MGEGGYSSLSQYLNNAEIGKKKSTAYSYYRIYKFYIVDIEAEEGIIASTQVNRLLRYLPILKKKEKSEAKMIAEEIRAKTNNDYFEDINQHVNETKIVERPYVRVCRACHKYKVMAHIESLCDCKDENILQPTGHTQ